MPPGACVWRHRPSASLNPLEPSGEVSFLLLQSGGIETLAVVQSVDFCHLILGQSKIKDIKIILDMLGIRGLGEDNVARLDVPAEDDLHIRLAILLGQFGEYRLVPRGEAGGPLAAGRAKQEAVGAGPRLFCWLTFSVLPGWP